MRRLLLLLALLWSEPIDTDEVESLLLLLDDDAELLESVMLLIVTELETELDTVVLDVSVSVLAQSIVVSIWA